MNKFQNWVKTHKAFSNYFLISLSLTFLDIIMSRILEMFVGVVEANTISLVIGFVIQYFLCSRKVYQNNDFRTALMFFLTWLVGLTMADSIVYFVRVIIFTNKPDILYFFIAKGFSIVIPFFFIYFLRKKLIITKGVNSTK